MRTTRTQSPYRGYTIIELLVALVIASIFFTSFFAVVATTLETLRTGDERTVAQQNARIALSTLMTEIRNATEIEPRPAYEASAPGLPGLPRDPDAVNRLAFTEDAWPILARSTDSSVTGYIELDHENAPGGTEQYPGFRDDGRPYDVRPLSPNRLSIKLGNSQYFGNTQYTFLNPQSGGVTSTWDLDNSNLGGGPGNADNPTASDLIVTYEHQVTPPRVSVYDPIVGPTIYDNVLDGLVKRLYVMTGTGGTPLILDTDSVNLAAGGVAERPSLTANYVPNFYLLRSFQSATPPNVFNWAAPPSSVQAPSGMGSPSRRDPGVWVPPVHLRQPVADHILDIRFRYWFTAGGRMFEVRYDPNLEHAALGGGGAPDCVNNGYYRYFDESGNEFYVWSHPTDGLIDVDETAYFADPQAYIDNYPFQALICTNAYEQGMLMFEGWRLISAVSVTIRAANQTALQEYVSTIDFTNAVAPGDPEFGLGFTDFSGANLSENMVNPLYRAVNNVRGGYFDPEIGTVYQPADTDSFDVIEPLASTNFDPTKFVTLQSLVAPPALRDRSDEAKDGFRAAFRIFKITFSN